MGEILEQHRLAHAVRAKQHRIGAVLEEAELEKVIDRVFVYFVSGASSPFLKAQSADAIVAV
jgi:hypothetical protein